MTYKGPKGGREGFKAKDEHIVDLSYTEEYCTILERLGFCLTAEVVKHREIYQCDGALVTLDTLPGIGTFSEIEASFDLSEDEAISVINKTAEMAGLAIIRAVIYTLLYQQTRRLCIDLYYWN
ncbi:MAG: hypothetical protein ALMCE001_06970 [Methanocorpusculum sp. MCE]|nr:MAG: hypothetical protein ALMCE001_06970 [Methanocorpusculum sp. MCE]